MNKRWWSAEVQYPTFYPFLLSANSFLVEADGNEEALRLLTELLTDAWERISPHPPPEIIAVHPGRLVLKDTL